jgi:hypothetical protein
MDRFFQTETAAISDEQAKCAIVLFNVNLPFDINKIIYEYWFRSIYKDTLQHISDYITLGKINRMILEKHYTSGIIGLAVGQGRLYVVHRNNNKRILTIWLSHNVNSIEKKVDLEILYNENPYEHPLITVFGPYGWEGLMDNN